MSEENIITVEYDPDNPPRGRTNWERVAAMTDEEVERLALSDPDCPPCTEEELRQFRRVNPGIGRPPIPDKDKEAA